MKDLSDFFFRPPLDYYNDPFQFSSLLTNGSVPDLIESAKYTNEICAMMIFGDLSPPLVVGRCH